MAAFNHADRKSDDVSHMDKLDPPEAQPTGGDDMPAGYFPVTAEEKALNRKINRKLDFCLLPFLSLLYLFNGLDRGNVGNAQTQG